MVSPPSFRTADASAQPALHPRFATHGPAIPIAPVTEAGWEGLRADLPPVQRAMLAAQGFSPKPGRHAWLHAEDGSLATVLLGVEATGARGDPFEVGRLASLLPGGVYELGPGFQAPRLAALGFLLGGYAFDRYRRREAATARLLVPEGVDGAALSRQAFAVEQARDLINTPANDLGPAELEAAVRQLGARHGAAVNAFAADDLLTHNFPMVHAVGRASARAPRLVDLTWGDPDAPRVTLVGKGVVFDTGGLNLKTEAGMLLMKKDMGGAAAMLALADLIMGAGLKVRLRLIVPCVENAVSGAAFRPGDVLLSRQGQSVEIGNTDAEGRLILADALALADEEAPDLIVCAATLTGAARVALGPDLPALFTQDDDLAETLLRHGAAENDPLWRLPLWRGYEAMLDSKVADVSHVGTGGFAGAITAALFLSRFVTKARAFAHVDLFAWTPKAKPGRPEGGECMAARGLFAALLDRYGS